MEILLNGLLAGLSLVVPKNDGLVLAGTLYGRGFSGNPRAIYLYMLRQPTIRFHTVLWITGDPQIEKTLIRHGLPYVRLYSLAGFWAIVRARLLVTGYNIRDVSYFQFLPGRFTKIQTWHGLPLKGGIPGIRDRFPRPLGYWLFSLERRSNHLCCTTSEVTKEVEEAMDGFYPRLTITGYPRNDMFFRPEQALIDYKSVLELGQYSRIILYCPTFRDGSDQTRPFSEHFLAVLNTFFADTNQILLVTRHHLDSIQGVSDQLSHIKMLDNQVQDIQDLLVDIDLMITDYSSIVLDYILTGKPAVFFPYDDNLYHTDRGFSIDYFADLPGPFAFTEEQLLELLQTVDDWSNTVEYRYKYERLVDRMHSYRDGDSCQRLCQVMESLH
ncbi:MAG: CDP-glycerol glycerophosphotransferase [Alcanivorax sp.]